MKNMGAMGALYSKFEIPRSGKPSDLDLRLYSRLCGKLNQEVVV